MAASTNQHSHIYINRSEDPRQRIRTVPMEVLSLGFSRTGTMTMKAALEILGIPTWHWITQAENPPDLAMWVEALRSKWEPKESGIQPFGRSEFDNLLGHWGAVTDQPTAFMAEELVAVYPGAKVILHERDVERWYESFSRTVIAGTDNPFIPIASRIDPTFLGQMSQQSDLIAKHLFKIDVPRMHGFLGLRNNPEFFDLYRKNARETYRRHNEMVRRITPPEKLLLFKLEDGWEPLCEFLGKPVPDVPSPRVNETAAVQEKIYLYIAESYKRSFFGFIKRAVPYVVVLLAMVACWVWARVL